MNEIVNGIKRAAASLDRMIGQPRFGIIQSYNPANYTATVLIQPEGVLSGWLPIQSPWLGNGWGFVFGPPPGTQAIIAPQEGDPQNYVIIGFVFAAQGTPAVAPPPVPAGEAWWQHSSGAFIKLTNAGGITSSGAWNHTGTFTATGEGTFNGGHTVSQHTHSDPQGGTTGTPTG